jgi:predicted DNA-binding transcriptional regulator AlpA
MSRTKTPKSEYRPLEPYLSADDVSKLLNVSPAWVRSHVTNRRPLLPHIRIDGVVRFKESEIEAFLESFKVRDKAA